MLPRAARVASRAAGFFGVGLGVETEEMDKTARTGQDGEGEERGEFVAGVRGRGRREGGGAEVRGGGGAGRATRAEVSVCVSRVRESGCRQCRCGWSRVGNVAPYVVVA